MTSMERKLRIELPARQSAFLWGPRKSGKTTWLRAAFPHSLWYDFLKTDCLLRLSKEPHLLREDLLAANAGALAVPVVLDEVQKVPQVLDEVHWLIESRGISFVMCGSSARKLKRGHANLLGGRAWRFEMFPLTSTEIPGIDLLHALQVGLLPDHYCSSSPGRSLKSYVADYLAEEIKAEGLVRNLGGFARFLDAMAFSHGELTNFANIARDCGVDAKTVRSYYDILVDTLLGRFVPPFATRTGRQSITAAEKFYLFDVGVANCLCRRVVPEEGGEAFGRAFEHFILMELWAHRAYAEKDFSIRFWRTKAGLEVDFVLGDGEVAIEVKGASRVDAQAMRSLKVFVQEFKPKKAMIVSREAVPRVHEGISVLPWRQFLQMLWAGEVV